MDRRLIVPGTSNVDQAIKQVKEDPQAGLPNPFNVTLDPKTGTLRVESVYGQKITMTPSGMVALQAASGNFIRLTPNGDCEIFSNTLRFITKNQEIEHLILDEDGRPKERRVLQELRPPYKPGDQVEGHTNGSGI